ncbi:hypothetical protein [Chitinophaga sp. MM2321]|uniref:hypothetical protein n=1 Tax=Chitinophaga sp. MM2321 TaxID=3137178 RepID=UPI0032D58D4C
MQPVFLKSPSATHDPRKSVVNDFHPGSVKDGSSSRYTDQRVETVAQRKLQTAADNSSQVKQAGHLAGMATTFSRPLQRVAAPANAVVQRKILLRNNKVYSDIVKEDTGPVIKMKKSRDNFLMQNLDDISKVNAGKAEDVHILSPHRHLIGETHTASQFAQAVTDWGWGARQLRENLSDNKLMPHKAGDKLRATKGSTEYGSLPLEDTMVKNLATAVISRDDLRNLSQIYKLVALQKIVAEEKEKEKNNEDKIVSLESILGSLTPLIIDDKKNDEKEKEEPKHPVPSLRADRPSINNIEVANTALQALHQIAAILEDLTNYAIKENSLLGFFSARDLPKEILTMLEEGNLFETLDEVGLSIRAFIRGNTVPDVAVLNKGIALMDHVITFYKLIIEKHQPDLFKNYNVAAADNLDSLDAPREEKMAQHIAQSPIPSLTKVGRDHLPGLHNRNIPAALLFHSYANFQEASKAPNVFSRI